MSIDKAGQLGDFDTVTREEYRRLTGTQPAPVAPAPAAPVALIKACVECGDPLTPVQIRRGGRFCSQRCSGMHNARTPARAKPVPVVAARPSAAKAEPAAVSIPVERFMAAADELGMVHIAAALAQLLLTIPGADVRLHVGPIDLEVHR